MLEQLIAQNRDLEEFTYIASHSLRAQIANISMLCLAMDGHGMTPSNLEIFERLFQSSSNLDTIIADLNTILTVKDHSAVLFEDLLSRIPASTPFPKFQITMGHSRNLSGLK